MSMITLKDGTFIHNEASLLDYLSSLGFDKFDIEDFKKLLMGDALDNAYREGYGDCHKESEITIDGYFCAARSLAEAVDNLCDDFRKQYKSAAILKVLDAIETCVRENRID